MDQKYQNLQSTKTQQIDNGVDAFPTDGIGNTTSEYAFIIIPLTPKLKAYINLTGCFPHKSSRGNEF
eukprot:13262818-Ditylum_brightwellii.AAC.1